MSARLLGEAIDHRQPKASALANRLGGKEGVEGAVIGALRHAASGVGDAQDHVITRFQIALGFGGASGQVLICGVDHQSAATGHGIPGVDHQVEQSAFQLVGVGLGDPQAFAQLHVQLDAFVDAALGNTARELADGFHFLRLTQDLFVVS